MEIEDIDNGGEQKKQKSKSLSLKTVLDGSWLGEKLNRNVGFLVLVVILVIFYIANGYSMEKLYREKNSLETELKELRFEAITKSADFMFIRKQSEVIKRIREAGMDLEESKEPPIKLYK